MNGNLIAVIAIVFRARESFQLFLSKMGSCLMNAFGRLRSSLDYENVERKKSLEIKAGLFELPYRETPFIFHCSFLPFKVIDHVPMIDKQLRATK